VVCEGQHADRTRAFLENDWVICADDRRLEGRVEGIALAKRLVRDEITGDPLAVQPDDAEIVIRIELRYPLDDRKLEETGNLSTTSDKSRDNVSALPRTLGIPTVDISGERERHVVINAGTAVLYQGHANTLLLPDGETMFCVWTLNHGWGEPFLKRSDDAGKTWLEVPIPANWNDSWCKHTSHPRSTRGGTSRGWLPTIHHVIGPDGKGRLFIWD
jgi:hypothetical protein